jgi:antitoxin VapB
MILLSEETEALARLLASARRMTVEATIQLALEAQARDAGIEQHTHRRRRMSVDEMLAFGSVIAAMLVLDTRSPSEIMDELNAL